MTKRKHVPNTYGGSANTNSLGLIRHKASTCRIRVHTYTEAHISMTTIHGTVMAVTIARPCMHALPRTRKWPS